MRKSLVAALVAIAAILPAFAATYRAELAPMPLDDETKAFIAGRGEATATIDNGKLVIEGSFGGLPSKATAAHLLISPAIGVPGAKTLELELAGSTNGKISGSYRLSRAQRDALRTGRLYVQIDSEKAPPGYSWGPKGTLWGWLLPDHPRAEPGVPQQGPWFIPQLNTPAR
jgi:hypothetical protein